MIHGGAAARDLGFIRFWVFGIWLVKLASDPIELVGLLPLHAFEPRGVLRLVPDGAWSLLLDANFLLVFRWTTVLVLALATAGILTRPACVIASLLLIFHQGVIRGVGLFGHAELALLYAAALLALFPCGDGFALLRPRRAAAPGTYGAALTAVAAALCLTYCFTGVYRAMHGGAAVFRGDMLPQMILHNSHVHAYYDLSLARWAFELPLLAGGLKLGLAVVTILEIGAPLCLVSRPFRTVFVALMVPFHVAAFLFIGPLFWENIALFVVLVEFERWLAPRLPAGERPVVFFDGVCGLCNRLVDFIISNDPQSIFRFASLQGETARSALGAPAPSAPDATVVLRDEAGTHVRSDAALRILMRLGGAWRAAGALRIVPRWIRDRAYDFIARRRYRWFGRSDACRVPTAAERDRFLA